MHQPEDIDIVRRVTAGEQAAYALLVQRYQHMVFTLALRFTGNREDAEEIAQDVFVKAYRNLGYYKGTGKFSTWLYTITKTTSFSALRSKRGKPEVVSQEAVGGRLEQMSGEKPGALSELRSRDTLLREAIACLQESDAEILTLFYHGEQNLEEIAQILGQSSNSVKVRLFRARQRLRGVLEQRYPKELKNLK